MGIYQQDEKDISKVFAFLRAQLQAKEKELLELQRADPCLLAPDFEQIDTLIGAIATLQLSTQEGSFVFASGSDGDDVTPNTSDCSTGFNSIKTLPSAIWLSPSNPVKQQNKQRPSIFGHLLSLPTNAYLASSRPTTFATNIKSPNQSLHRIPMVNHVLFMPLNAFKSPSSNTSTSTEIKNNKNLPNDALPTTGSMKSILHTGTNYSKEFWLRNSQNASCN